MRDEERGQRLIAVALLALVAFNFPLLAVAEAGPRLLGLPPLVRLSVRRLGRPDRAARADRRAAALR